MIRIGLDRIGLPPVPPPRRPLPSDTCPLDGTRGEFRRTALVCPRCGRVLGGI